MKDAYLGPSYSDEHIEDVFRVAVSPTRSLSTTSSCRRSRS